MGQRKREKKTKSKATATREQREKSADEIRRYLNLNGLPHKGLWPIEELLRIVDEYVESGQSASGTIHVPEVERDIHYLLSARVDPNDASKSRAECALLYTGDRTK